MIVKPAFLSSFFQRGNPQIKAVLFYGQDEGYVEELREKATLSVVPDLKDPFRIVDLKVDVLASDIGLLFAEANAISLMGGRRVIRIREADKRITGVMQEFLEKYSGDALVVMTAGSLAKNDTLRKLFENSDKAYIVACYADDAMQLKQLVVETLSKNNLSADSDVVDFIASNLGADRMLSRSELAKLVAYMGNEKTVTIEDADMCVGDVSVLSVENFIYEVAGGKKKEIQKTLERLYSEGQSPIGLLRAVSFHFKKLHLSLGRMAEGESADTVIKRLVPPLHFKRTNAFKDQLNVWTLQKIEKVLRLLTDTERQVKFGEIPQELLCARTFLQIASLVR